MSFSASFLFLTTPSNQRCLLGYWLTLLAWPCTCNHSCRTEFTRAVAAVCPWQLFAALFPIFWLLHNVIRKNFCPLFKAFSWALMVGGGYVWSLRSHLLLSILTSWAYTVQCWLDKTVDGFALAAACTASSSTVKTSQPGTGVKFFRSLFDFFLSVLQPICVVVLAIGFYHLVVTSTVLSLTSNL